jgi:hypothetical protein
MLTIVDDFPVTFLARTREEFTGKRSTIVNMVVAFRARAAVVKACGSVVSWTGRLRQSADHEWRPVSRADTWRMALDLVADQMLEGDRVEVVVLPADMTPSRPESD